MGDENVLDDHIKLLDEAINKCKIKNITYYQLEGAFLDIYRLITHDYTYNQIEGFKRMRSLGFDNSNDIHRILFSRDALLKANMKNEALHKKHEKMFEIQQHKTILLEMANELCELAQNLSSSYTSKHPRSLILRQYHKKTALCEIQQIAVALRKAILTGDLEAIKREILSMQSKINTPDLKQGGHFLIRLLMRSDKSSSTFNKLNQSMIVLEAQLKKYEDALSEKNSKRVYSK